MNRFRTADVAAMLRRRIQWGMHLGLVRPADRLPSLRAAAAEFDVDQRSVLAAYRELEREGIVDMRPRSGIYVSADPHRGGPQLPGAARWMCEMFLQGYSRGVAPVALGQTLTSAMTAASLTAACVECNADQILWMARILREEFGLSTTWAELGLAPEAMAERLKASDFIVTTTFHAAEARRIGDEHGLPVVVVTAGRDDAGALRAQLGRGPVYLVGTDERYARKLLEAAESGRWMTNLRAMVLEQFKSAEIPAGAPLAFTTAAADMIADDLPPGAVVLDYGFSNESRTEIIALMLNAALRATEGTRSSLPDLAAR